MKLTKTSTLLLLALTVVVSGLTSLVAHAAQTDTARFGQWSTGESFMRMNGSPVLRAILTPDNSTAEDNTTAAGGSAVTYTFLGGERVCVQALTTNAYVQVIAAASQTTANSFLVTADQSILSNCYTLQNNETKVSALCTASGPCTVKLFELR